MLTVAPTLWKRTELGLLTTEVTDDEEAFDVAYNKESGEMRGTPAGWVLNANPPALAPNTPALLACFRERLYAISAKGPLMDPKWDVAGAFMPSGGFSQFNKETGLWEAPADIAGLVIPETAVALTPDVRENPHAGHAFVSLGPRVHPMLADYKAMKAQLEAELNYTTASLASLAPCWVRLCPMEKGVPGPNGLRTASSGYDIIYDGTAWFLNLHLGGSVQGYVGWALVDNDCNFLHSAYCTMEANGQHSHRTGRLSKYSLAGWIVGPASDKLRGERRVKSGAPRRFRPMPVNAAGEVRTGPTDLYSALPPEIVGKLINAVGQFREAKKLGGEIPMRFANTILAEGDVPIFVTAKGNLILYGDGTTVKNTALITEKDAPLTVLRQHFMLQYTLNLAFPGMFTKEERATIIKVLTEGAGAEEVA